MLKKLYANPAAIIFISLLVIAGGIIRFFGLPVALYPDASRPVLFVELNTSTQESEDFRAEYGTQIEGKLMSLKGVEAVEGFYYKNDVTWEVRFNWNSDNEQIQNDVKSALSRFKPSFPKEWGGFNYYFKSNSSSGIYLNASSKRYTEEELWATLKSKLLPELQQISGIDDAFIVRPWDTFVQIEAKPSRMLEENIGADDVVKVLKAHEYDKSLPRIKSKGGERFPILVPLKEKSLEQIRSLIVAKRGVRTVYLSDIATVSLAKKPPRHFFKKNGERALLIGGSVQSDGNIARACTDFESVVRKVSKEIDPDIVIDILVNPAEFIQEAIENIGESVFSGIMIATLVLFLFLASIRLTLIIAIAIPLSLIGGIIVMSLTGIELNLISLGAMALAVGMVVDGSIVVLENCHRHLALSRPQTALERLEVVYHAVMEVKTAVLASLLTTIIVFAPLAFTSPLANAILGDLAKVMVCVLSISVLVTIFVVPPLILLLKSQKKQKTKGLYLLPTWFSKFLNLIENLYVSLLKLLMEKRSLSASWVAVTGVCLGLSGYLLTMHVKREILAIPDTDKVWFLANFPNQEYETSDVEKKLQPIEDALRNDFKDYFKGFMTVVKKDQGQFLCSLKNKKQIKEVKALLEKQFKNTPLIHFYVHPWNPTALEIDEPALLKIRISGNDTEERRELLDRIEEIVQKEDDVGQVRKNPGTKKSNDYEIKYDENLLRHLETENGYSREKIESMVRYALHDKTIKSIKISGEPDLIPVRFGWPEYSVQGPNDFKNLQFRVGDKLLSLRHVMKLEPNPRWSQYYTQAGIEATRINVWQKESSKADKQDLRLQLLSKLKADSKIDMSKLSFDDPDKEITENIESLVLALALALALIWVVISLQFGSVWQTLVIMSAIPLGFIGVSFALWVFDSTLSVNSMLGLILLCGTAVNNSIIFVDFFNHKSAEHPDRDFKHHLLETARLRFRPILITTATTILGMFPIALGMGSGGEILQPLGIAVCGGLGLSTFLTLVMVPLIMYIGHKKFRFN